MKILVTGGAGFIGSHVVDTLIEKGHDILVIDNLSQGSRRFLNSKARFLRLDINSKRLANLKHENFNAIVHLAAQINARSEDAVFDAQVNIVGSVNILQFAADNRISNFVYISSCAVYGEPQYIPLDEKHPIQPLNNYGISKHTVEHYLEAFHHLHNINFTALRLANVYGPRQNHLGEAGVVAIFIHQILKDKPLSVFGDGKQTRDFVYVEDVAYAVAKSLTPTNSILNISTNKSTSVNQLVSMLQKLVKKKLDIKHTPPVKGEVRRTRVDNSLAVTQLAWTPKTGLSEGLKKTLQHYLSS